MKTVLVVLDGWGYSKKLKGNAIKLGKTPVYEEMIKKYPTCLLKTYGSEVGLPPDGLGGSKVGHEHIGAGRIVKEECLLIDELIENKKFFRLKNLKTALETKRLHLVGLVSDGHIHSRITQLFALLEAAKKEKVPEVYIHFIADGRDAPPFSAKNFAQQLTQKINELKIGKIATLCGRYYSMDRDKKWDRTQKAFMLMTRGKGTPAKDIFEAIDKAYSQKIKTDQDIPPFILDKTGIIGKKDSVIMFNFRADRGKQLWQKLSKYTKNLTTMTQYDREQKPSTLLVEKPVVDNTFGEYISELGMKQLRIAETEKYAHVTYFFNGGKAKFKGEDRKLIPSPKTPSYDKTPKMSAKEITEVALKEIKSNKYNFVLINYANPDMLGHTGNLEKTIEGVEFVDKCLGQILDACEKNNYLAIVTADHGNAEEMYDEFGNISTSHSKNPVTFTIATTRPLDLKNGGLKNIAPTILEFFNIEKPKEMTSKSLMT